MSNFCCMPWHKQKRRLVKKIIAFLRSMNFAIVLLVLIVIMSIIGSLIPQGNSVNDYAVLYPKVFKLVLFCKFDRIFSSWYFILILAFYASIWLYARWDE